MFQLSFGWHKEQRATKLVELSPRDIASLIEECYEDCGEDQPLTRCFIASLADRIHDKLRRVIPRDA